jgi:CHASE2 domain-containing sensor protein/signal transduction histidine kinase
VSETSWRTRLLHQRVWFLIALLCLTTLLYLSTVFWRTDLELFDAALPTAPAPGDVVIVAIDEASIAALGRWPWSRAVHASLMDRLREDGARAVALDILFTEPDPNSPEGDIALARATERGPPTVLPLLADLRGNSQVPRERLPIPILAQAAAGLGHADLEVDPDGIVRSVFLREGPGAATREYLAAALLEHTPGAGPLQLRGERHPKVAGSSTAWVRDNRVLIPFLGPPGHFAQVSYVDVLRGDVNPSAIRGKWVLVGMTAQGLGDEFPTPRSGQSRPMPGVEIGANVLQGLKSGTTISRTSMPVTILLGLIPVALVGVGLQRLAPGRSLLLTALLVFATLGLSVLLLRAAGWWWPPTASLAVLLAAYPLWSWQRLEATQTFLEAELRQLARESFPLLPDLPSAPLATHSDDFLQRRIELLQQATRRLRSARRLFGGTIDALPDATILADTRGQIVLVNPAARALFGSPDNRPLEGTAVDDLFSRRASGQLQFSFLAGRAPCTVEIVLTQTGQHCLVRAVAFHDELGVRAGTIIDVADVTELRAAQREREEVLRFLSHDMRSPATSLLGLAQLQRDRARALSHEELSQRLDLLAQRVLTLVDNFVALARAESADPAKFEHFDLRDAAQDAYDEVWAAAQAREIAISPCVSEEASMVSGDRHLLARAVVNLLSNAIKFSAPGTGIELLSENVADNAVISIVDQGAGIEPERRAALFRRFSRGLHRGSDPGGAGLGLAFVRVVAEKHGGAAWAEHERERGTVFRLSVPLAGAELAEPDTAG